MDTITNHTRTMSNPENKNLSSRPLSAYELCIFARKFSAFLSSSNSAGNIDSLIKKKTAGRVTDVLAAIAAEFKAGATISQAFMKYERLFGPFFCTLACYGESAKNPGAVFQKLSEFYERQYAFRKKIFRFSRFPLIILFGSTGCFLSLLVLFIPRSLPALPNSPETQSFMAAALFHLIAFAYSHQLLLLLSLLALLLPAFLVQRGIIALPWLPALSWKLPIAGDLFRKNALRSFSRALSTSLSCGLTPLNALRAVIHELKNPILEKKMLSVIVGVPDTRSTLDDLVERFALVPTVLVDRTSSSQVADLMTKAADFQEENVESALGAAFILAGPVIVAIVGSIGLSIALSLYLTVFKVVANN